MVRITSGGSIVPTMVRLRKSRRVKPPAAVNGPRLAIWFPSLANDADAAVPPRVVVKMAPAGWVMAPVTLSRTVVALSAPESARSPFTVSVMPVESNSVPRTARLCPSVMDKPPALMIVPSVLIALSVAFSVMLPMDDTASSPVVTGAV